MTGQRSFMDDPTTTATEGFGLMFYNARWYDVALGRFTQPDTIIPEQTQGTQAWDRYAGMNNNPVRYSDPSGHYTCDHITNQYAHAGCEAATPQAETYEEAARQAEVRKYRQSRPISGVHIGTAVNVGIAAEYTAYEQTDILFDWQSGTFYQVATTGTGTYVGTPNGLGIEAYVGTSNVYGIPKSASPLDVARLLGGENVDLSAEVAGDFGVVLEAGGAKGLSLDLNDNGDLQTTTAGQMYALESSFQWGVAATPTLLDVGVEVGQSYSTATVYYQIPWWPNW